MPLDTFAAICGIHPLHFNQVRFDNVSGCGQVWLQYDWQAPSAVSRESVAYAIRSAEDSLEDFLGFPVAPKYYADILREVNGSPIILPKAYYITGGVKKVTLVQEAAGISYDDIDGDGYSEQATVTASGGNAVCYPGESIDHWQIRPVKIVDDIIYLNRHDLVLKDRLEDLKPVAVDGSDDSFFLDTVDVYLIETDPSVQAVLRACNFCLGQGCTACQFDEQTACLRAENYKNSIVNINPGTWNTDQWVPVTCDRNKYFAGSFNFLAGWSGEPIWDLAVAYLALTRLDVGLCECPTVQRRLEYWTTDLSKSDRTASYKIPDALRNCPWGYQRGAMYAYELASKYRMAQSVSH